MAVIESVSDRLSAGGSGGSEYDEFICEGKPPCSLVTHDTDLPRAPAAACCSDGAATVRPPW